MKIRGLNSIRKLNKKGGNMGGTAVWIPAILIIFVALMLFFTVTFFLSGKKSFSGNMEQIEVSSFQYDYSVTQNFFIFLNSPVEYGSEKILVKDLIKGDEYPDSSKFIKFKDLSSNFLSKNLGVLGPDNKRNYITTKAWIRIYDKDEKITQYYFNDKYKNYEGNLGESFGRNSCDPEDYESFFTKVIIEQNKTVALCIKYENA